MPLSDNQELSPVDRVKHWFTSSSECSRAPAPSDPYRQAVVKLLKNYGCDDGTAIRTTDGIAILLSLIMAASQLNETRDRDGKLPHPTGFWATASDKFHHSIDYCARVINTYVVSAAMTEFLLGMGYLPAAINPLCATAFIGSSVLLTQRLTTQRSLPDTAPLSQGSLSGQALAAKAAMLGQLTALHNHLNAEPEKETQLSPVSYLTGKLAAALNAVNVNHSNAMVVRPTKTDHSFFSLASARSALDSLHICLNQLHVLTQSTASSSLTVLQQSNSLLGYVLWLSHLNETLSGIRQQVNTVLQAWQSEDKPYLKIWRLLRYCADPQPNQSASKADDQPQAQMPQLACYEKFTEAYATWGISFECPAVLNRLTALVRQFIGFEATNNTAPFEPPVLVATTDDEDPNGFYLLSDTDSETDRVMGSVPTDPLDPVQPNQPQAEDKDKPSCAIAQTNAQDEPLKPHYPPPIRCA